METNNTNLNLYKSFIVAYETKNLHRAAEILLITREGVRKNIHELGKQLGVILFLSNNKGIIPTPEAIKIYPSIKNAIQAIHETEKQIGKHGETIKILVESAIAEFKIAAYMKQFAKTHPSVQISFVKQGADIIIADEKTFDTRVKTMELFNVTTAFAATPEFLQKNNLNDIISLHELTKYTIIATQNALRHLNLSANIIETTSSETTLKMVKNSLGIGVFSTEFLKVINDKNIVTLKVQNFVPPLAKIVCAYEKLTRPAKEFIIGLSKFTAKY
jgi:DNA-binding transcriptional LysR family regulator